MPLKGQKLFIIGGSSGIGKATALEAIGQGAHVIIAGRREDRLASAQTEIGGRVDYVVLDVREPREMDYCFEQAGGFDHLVVTAAEDYKADFVEIEIDDARTAFETKFWGQFLAVQRSIPFLRKGGSITLFSGSAGHR
ncbi:MAG: SDR family NAD(P)-dependent oxidoreductase, partial [Rhodothermales bacterium]